VRFAVPFLTLPGAVGKFTAGDFETLVINQSKTRMAQTTPRFPATDAEELHRIFSKEGL
jgi:hypothetical protein